MNKDVIIVGAGASGLICGCALDDRAVILEATPRAGTKLLMAGSGRCNLTHGGDIREFPGHYGDHGKKIRGILYKYNNAHFCRFMEKLGVPLTEREDAKVFPASMNGRDVLDALLTENSRKGVAIKRGYRVVSIRRRGDGEPGFLLTAEKDGSEYLYCCRFLVIATGGCSYPSTGSDGKMFGILKRDLGIAVEEPAPALSPVYVKDYPFGDLSGMSFEGVRLVIPQSRGKAFSARGDLLFAERKLSGPLILDNARRLAAGGAFIIGFLPGLSGPECAARMKADFPGSGRSPQTYMSAVLGLPRRFSVRLAELAGVSEMKVSALSGEQIKKLSTMITGYEFTVERLGDFSEAMATRGGVSLDILDLTKMRVRETPGLYIIGEAADIDGDTGGYNLQFAYSSACAAAASVKAELGERT